MTNYRKYTLAFSTTKNVILAIIMLSATNLSLNPGLLMQKSLKQEHFLWQLMNIQKDIEIANDELDVEVSSRKAIVDELGNYEAEASKKKKEKTGYLKEISQCERKIKEKNNKVDNVMYPILTILSANLIFLDPPFCWLTVNIIPGWPVLSTIHICSLVVIYCTCYPRV